MEYNYCYYCSDKDESLKYYLCPQDENNKINLLLKEIIYFHFFLE